MASRINYSEFFNSSDAKYKELVFVLNAFLRQLIYYFLILEMHILKIFHIILQVLKLFLYYFLFKVIHIKNHIHLFV